MESTRLIGLGEFPPSGVGVEPSNKDVEPRNADRVARRAGCILVLSFGKGHMTHVIVRVEVDAIPAALEADADFHLGLTGGYALVEDLFTGSDHTKAGWEGPCLARYPIVVHGSHFCKIKKTCKSEQNQHMHDNGYEMQLDPSA